MDDTFTVLHEYDIENFTTHLNSIDSHIQFTIEPEVQGKMPFLDTCIHMNEDASTKTTVYRKPTHTDQYLNFQSNHHLEHKRSVVRSLLYRAENVVSNTQDQEIEKNHVATALKANGFPDWMLNIPIQDREHQKKSNTSNASQQDHKEDKIILPLPYIRGTSEKLARIFKKHGVTTYHKPTNTIRSLLVNPKDRTPIDKKCGVVYHIQCEDCDSSYIGETARSMSTRFKEHTATNRTVITAVGEHCKNTGHAMSWDNVKIIGNESSYWKRKIKEAIEIRCQTPQLNRDQGMELPAIYDSFWSHDVSHVTKIS